MEGVIVYSQVALLLLDVENVLDLINCVFFHVKFSLFVHGIFFICLFLRLHGLESSLSSLLFLISQQAPELRFNQLLGACGHLGSSLLTCVNITPDNLDQELLVLDAEVVGAERRNEVGELEL